MTRLSGAPFTVNPDLLKFSEATPDLTLTLVDGSKVVVAETEEELLTAVLEYRASVLALARRMERGDHPAGGRRRREPGDVIPIREKQ